MGVEYRGVLCVGYTYEQVKELYENCEDENGDYRYDDIYQFCDEEGLTSFSPYYYADKSACIYGDEIESSDDYCYAVVGGGLDERIRAVSDRLRREFSMEPKAYIMAHGW